MKGIILGLGIAFGYSALWACPGHDKEYTLTQVSEDEEIYRSIFLENADLSNYKTVELLVSGVMCADCIGKIEANLRKVKGIVAIEYHWKNKTLKVWGEEISTNTVMSAIKKAGYKAKPKEA